MAETKNIGLEGLGVFKEEVDKLLKNKVDTDRIGVNNGVASLGDDGKVPEHQLPSYMDDVVEYASTNAFPATGESGKIYIALDTNKTYRWGGTVYVPVNESLALGETSSTAFPGNRGKAMEDKLANIEDNAQTNKIETVKVNGTALTPDGNKAVDITIPSTTYATAAEIRALFN